MKTLIHVEMKYFWFKNRKIKIESSLNQAILHFSILIKMEPPKGKEPKVYSFYRCM